jgi:hypothetical protein
VTPVDEPKSAGAARPGAPAASGKAKGAKDL